MRDEPNRPTPPQPQSRKGDPIQRAFEERAKRMIRGAMEDRGMSMAELSQCLGALGVNISAGGVANKISRGGFSAAFMLQCLEALDSQTGNVDEADQLLSGF